MAQPAIKLSQLSREELDLLLEKLKREKGKAQAGGLALAPRPRDGGTLPLSFAQQRLWLLAELDPGSAAYNVPGGLVLRGPLDAAALARGLAAIVHRHEALRTTFVARGGEPAALAAPSLTVRLPVIDLSAIAGAGKVVLGALGERQARRPFDLQRGPAGQAPLLRALLVRLGGREHGLLLTLHHIVSDGWSLGVLVHELAALYRHFSAGGGAAWPLPPLALQYADFAAWQRDHLTGDVLERQLAYWRKALAGLPPALELPADRPRPAVASLAGRRLPLAVPEGVAEGAAALARRSGATTFMVMLAAYSVLLARLAGQRDLVVGSTIANRTRSEVEGLIGFFVNTLALRVRVSGDPTFRELLARVRETTLAAYAQQDLPFEKLVEELAPARSLSHSPLFQVALDFQTDPLAGASLPGLELERLDFDGGTAKFDLLLSLSEGDGGLAGYLEYATDLFDEPTARRLARRFGSLLAAVVADPDARVGELPLIAAAERHQLLCEWGPAGAPAGLDEAGVGACLHELVAAQAALTPDAEALVFGEQRLSYRDLDARSTSLARHLAWLGVGPEVRVGIAAERTPAMLVGMLAIQKAGGAYVPLDPSYPAQRLAWMLEDMQSGSEAPLVLTQCSLLPRLEGVEARTVCLDESWDSGEEAEPRQADASGLAYVIYTSGSTGRPKGVAIIHRSAVAFVRWAQGVFTAEELAGVLAATSINFDLSIFELFVTLSVGGKVILAANALELPSLPAASEVTLVNTVPSAMTELVRMGGLPASVRTVNLAGEPLARSLVDGAYAASAVERVLNLYGPSEDTTYSTFTAVPREERRAPTIGRPVAGTQARVLDRGLRPAPVGVPGELLLGGAGLARGYLGRPALTAERFVPDPFGAQELGVGGARLYRTGDLARFLADGQLEFLGRIDHQVKIRGFRIELGEVEAALAAHPQVEEAVVLAREDRPGDTRLAAYVVARAAVEPVALTDHLRARLPAYMLPSDFVLLPALPRTPNGKLDRKALPAPERTAGEARDTAYGAPVEELLAGLWCEVLGRERVGLDEDFFALGGHSLLAAQLVSRVSKACGVEVPLKALFAAPTIAALAAVVESARRQGAEPPPAIVPLPRGEELPLSFAQERLWFLDLWEPGSPVYNIAAAVDFDGPLQPRVLRRSVHEVVRRHEALRTVFAARDGLPVQRVEAPSPFRLPAVDLAGLGEEARRREAGRLASAEARRPFDLSRSPMLRMTLVRLDTESSTALLTLHHIAADGWSLNILLREVTALYRAFAAGGASPLAELAVQYADFAVWQRAWLQGEVLARQLAVWRERLADAPQGLDLPTDRPRPAVQSLQGGQRPVALPPGLSRQVGAFGRHHGATSFMTLLAALQALLGRLSGQRDVLVGAPVAYRNQAEVEPLIGFFVNTLVLRGDLSGDPPFSELVDRVRAVTLEAFGHQDLPFERLVEELRPERDLSRPPLVQVLLAHQAAARTAAHELEIPGLSLVARPLSTGTSKFDLTLSLAEGPGGELGGHLEYDVALFDEATAARFAGWFETLLAGALAEPGLRLSELPLLTAAERLQLAEWNASAAPADDGACLHDLVAAQAARAPDAIAVEWHGERLSYAELRRRSSALARHLRSLGVGPEVRVGIATERSLELAVGLLAVLEAGGAYVPLDLSYPAQRLAWMLEDMQSGVEPPLVLTQYSLLSRLEGMVARTVCFDEGWGSENWDFSEEAEPRQADASGLAYLIYTSGSTGRPKGVAITHRSAVAFARWAQEVFSREELAGVLAATSITFDLSIFELFVTLSSGGTVILAANALELPRLPARDQVTLINTVPSAIDALVRGGDLPASVRTVNLAGEPLEREVVRRVYAQPGVRRVLNLYGPSEDTTYSTFTEVPRGSVPTIGRPVAGSVARILDRGMRRLPVGVPGELCLGGAGLARGYLDRPGLTAERFVPDPFGAETPGIGGGRLYRTGDLARWLPSGELEFLGRLDHQVKVRGFRIELGEIEAALDAHPAVARAVVLARDAHPGAAPGDRRLIAYVMPAGEAVTAAELRRWAATRLPEFMIPSAFVTLAALPLTPNGKVDRKALARLEPEPEARLASGRALESPTEELLAGIWSELLGRGALSADDSFFELGGHSLLAARVVARVSQLFGVELPLRALFESPTLGALAARIEADREAPSVAAPPLARVPRDQPLALSFSQERLWFLDRLEPDTAAYNLPFAARLEGTLDVTAFRRAVGEIVRRHEALRTTFAPGEDGTPVQVIAPPGEQPPVAVLDYSRCEQPFEEAWPRLVEEAHRPFDLARGPLLRVLLLRLAAESHLALVVQHHIASDGWSIGVFLSELTALYRGETLPELPVQYADYAAWQREWLQGEALASNLAWWRERLAGAPAALALPTDRPRPPVASSRGASLPVAFPEELVSALTALGRRQGATLFMTLLAAFQTLLARLSGERRLVVGSPVANRSRVETEGLIGFFLNTLPLPGDLAGDPGFPELLGRVRETALGAYAHQDLPFEKLVTELAPERNLAHAPIFQVLLVLQNLPPAALELPGITLEALAIDSDSAKLDLVLNLSQTAHGLEGRWVYKTDLFDRATVARFAGHLGALLAGIAGEPERRISELPLLSAAEAQQLREWNGTAAAYRGEVCLHDLICEQAERTPDAIAVSYESDRLSYGRLIEAASALAWRLRELGVGPEVRVGIAAERSLELVVGLVAILEAGGAYVPLDPAYPPERLAWMVEDSRLAVLLTQERLLAALPEHGARVLLLDGEGGCLAPEMAVEQGPRTPSGARPDNLAYVIYTSGSTGRPKGAMNSHRGIVNRLLWMQERYGLGPADRVLQKTPASFDVSVWEFFWPLLIGARLAMARPGGHGDSAYLVDTIAAEGITTLHFVPSMLQVFAAAPGLERCDSLQRVMASGEALPRDLVERFLERTGAPLHNLYGPTEAAVDVTHWTCERGPRQAVPIGRPVANTAIHLLDRALRPVPVGVAGELFIGGVQVGRGYWRRPGLTAERFVPDPLSAVPGARLYRTGDLARAAPDGAVEYLGRLDHQVKIRGFRIELGEIEEALAALPGVRDAVVLALDPALGAAGGDRRLVAFVVAPETTSADLKSALSARLPEHMVPGAFVRLESLPLSPSGKADRLALAKLRPAEAVGPGYAPPRTALERYLVELFQEAVGAERPGIHDGFFALGGSSISGAILINRLQEKLGEIVHVVAIFDHPTAADLAAYLVRDYPEAVARIWGAEVLGEGSAGGRQGRIGDDEVERLRRLVPSVSWRPSLPRNPPAIFLLSPPRSGSTLLRVMLAGHPRLFAPPELELLGFADMAERRAAFSGRESFWLEGLRRAVMEVRQCGPEEATETLAAWERDALPTQELYRQLQGSLGERMLVDKTPSYALDPALLERIEETFEEPRYLHLTRHPHGMIRSFEEARLEQVFFRHPHPFSRRELAELVWVASHDNVERFLAGVPAERSHRLRFEDLVARPEAELLEAICAFLGIPYHADMAEPYKERQARMTDGVFAESRMLGDVKFHLHGRVEASVAERWRDERTEDFLGEPTRALAAALGYEVEPAQAERTGEDRAPTEAWAPIERLPRRPGEALPLSFAQERLWFLDRLDPGSAAYNIPAAFRLEGRLSLPALASAAAEIARRHEVLRATFVERDGRPLLLVAEPRPVPLPVLDLTKLPEAARRAEAERLGRREAARSFDLTARPPVRLALLRLAGEEWIALLTLHHIAADGWSMGVFVRELQALYAARVAGTPSPLPEPPIQYADYAAWQRGRLSGAALEAELAWWHRELAGAPAALELPTDRPRPAVQSLAGGERPFALPPELSQRLRDLARREGATLFMTVLAAFQALLGRLSGQPRVLVGSPVANRHRAETEGLIGFFVNTLALAGDLSGEPTFRELLARSRRASRGAFAHAEVPFERLVEELRRERDLSRPPLFQVMLAYQNAPAGALKLSGLTLTPVRTASGTSKFELTLAVIEAGEGSAWHLAGSLEHSTELFDPTTVQRLLGQLEALLEGAAADPERRLGELPLLSAPEMQQVGQEWAAGPELAPGEACLHQLFEAQARRTPEAIALVRGEERWTYRGLDRRANLLARRLRELGVGTEGAVPEQCVGVCLERSEWLPAGLLAVLKAGGAYVPLDPAYPAERLALLAADARLSVLLSRTSLLANLADFEWHGPLLCLDAESASAPVGLKEDDGEVPLPRAEPHNLAYLIYTSGSTGRPKGAAIEHASAVAMVRWAREIFPAEDLAGVLASTSVSFDLSVFEIFVPLSWGGTVVLAGNALELPAVEAAVTLVNTVPSAIAELVRQGAVPASVRTVNLAGEPLKQALAERVYERTAADRVFNLYGPSEDTTYSTVSLVPRGAEPTIGRTIAGTRGYVLDAGMRPLPAGVPGELFLGGAGLARGYLHRPATTAERFVPNPFASDSSVMGPGTRLYRTGDLTRWHVDGELEFLGRRDFQVKIRGFRIELGEIEARLAAHPAVAEAVVLALPVGEDTRLAACWLSREGEARVPAVAELKSWMRRALPEHMVPAAFVHLEAWPLTPNGKVDRRALAELGTGAQARPEAGGHGAEHSRSAEGGLVEGLLAGLWAELLGVERVGLDDDFFALGGHSLLATRLVSRVRESLGVEIPLRALFESPTVAGLAGTVTAALRREAGGAAPRIGPPPVGAEPRLSFAQERLWFLDQLAPGSAAYNLPAALRLEGRLDLAAFRRTLGEIVGRHEVLRTSFPESAGRPSVHVAAPAPLPLAVIDLSGLAGPGRKLQAEALARREAGRPFDLRRGPLVRAGLLRLGGEDWVALLTMHHIVSDGWSMGVLVHEIAVLYAAFSAGEASPLAPLPVQYAGYAAWQRAWLAGDVLEAQLAWWREHLAGAPTVLELPADRPRPAAHSAAGASVPVALPAELSRRLRGLSQREGATLFMTLLAGFQALLGRWSGQEDLLVGSPVANRTRGETEELIGLFANILALRGRPGLGRTFRQLLAEARESSLGAYAHQDLPFERLVEALQPRRDLSRPPLVQVMLVLQNAPREDLALPGLKLAPVETASSTAKFELTLGLAESGHGDGWRLAGALEYSTALFDRTTALRLRDQLEALLAGAVEDPERRLGDLPLLSTAEGWQARREWNDTATSFPREALVHELFEAWVDRAPERPAVSFGDETVTYGELEARANRLARHLLALGVGPESRVALCLDRSTELVVALLAILKAGGAFVPLDPTYPRERLELILDDTEVAVLVTDQRLLAALPAAGVEVVCVDADRDAITRRPADRLSAGELGSDGLAYVMYTSGSTGKPKGVAVPHRAVVRLVRETGYARFAEDEVFLQLAPVSFDASTLEIWGALANGGRLAVHPPGVPSAEELDREVERLGVTSMWLTAGLFQLVMDGMVDGDFAGLRGLRQLLAGGDVLSVPHVEQALAALPGCRLINGYGPTENTTFTCCHTVTPATLGGSVPLGRPIANTTAYVLDRGLHPVPRGVSGELYTGGDGLARGYLGRPAATAERFVPDPFGPEASAMGGARLYRTGDLVRRRADGLLEFLGRADTQVKLRGFRVEPGEIEAALCAHPAVLAAAVVLREQAGDKRLAVFAVARGGAAPPPPGDLKSFLATRLPDYMVPASFAFLDALPLNANGKVDRRALVGMAGATLAGTAPGPAEAYRPPRSPLEELTAGLWAELLAVERVGVDDDFFALGGHSLLASRLTSRLRQELGVEVPVRTVFESPTLGALSAAIADALGGGTASRAPQLVPRSPDAEPAISFAQERLWFLDRLEPGSAAYNVPVALRLEGRLDVAAFRRTLGEIARRHEALRTTFHESGGRPVARIAPPSAVSAPVIDLSGLGEATRRTESERRLRREAGRPFDLGRGPLVRTVLLRLAAEEWVAFLSLHHIVSDGWSMGLLVGELRALYSVFAAEGESPLPELPVQYADYAAWQRDWLSGEVLASQLAYWRGHLAGAPRALELPTDRPRPAVQSFAGASLPVSLPPELSRRLLELSLREGATLFMTLLAGFQALLARWSGQQDLVVGSPVANRTRSETEGLIGFFVNTLALRGRPERGRTFRPLLAEAREASLGAYAHQELPLERLVEELQPERDLSRPPLFQVMLVFQNAPREELDLPGLALSTLALPSETAKFELTLALAETGDGEARRIVGAVEYSTALFDSTSIRRLVGHFETLLAEVVEDPERRLGQLALLTAAERHQLAREWVDDRALPRDACLHGLFAEQARRTPDAIALICGEERLSYGDLDRRARALALRLRELGVGGERAVGVCLERSADMVTTLLAVLRAGGAYVPLDPAYPAERLAFVAADARVSVVVSRAGLLDRLEWRGPTLYLDSEAAPPVAGEPADAGHDTAAEPGSLAYFIYTSGSTGRPKGAAIEHRSAVALVRWALEVFTPAELARVLASTSISFDLSIFELFVPLACGGAVVLAENALALPEVEAAPTLVNTVPSAIAELVRMGAVPPSVRTVNLAGEPLSRALVDRVYALPSVERVFNLYGPSEDTTYSTFVRVPSGSIAAPTIGRPVAGTRALVLDEGLRRVPAGVAGELYLGGAGLARGYLGRPALTAERFVPDPCGPPLSGDEGARLYRTGDLARWRADGELEFLGRSDHQVKVRGFRIELGEIEAALSSHPQVAEAAVLALPAGEGDTRLVAFVAPARLASRELRAFLSSRLPEPMLPSAFVALAALPLNPNGKIDRRVLAALGADERPAGSGEAGRAPSTPTEELLAGIWAEVLGVEKAGADDDFFALGGHSLLATRVVSRLREVFGVELPLKAVFAAPTLAALAAEVERARADAPADATVAPPIRPTARSHSPQGDRLPLSFAQERLWFLDQLEPGSATFNLPAQVRLAGRLEPAVLARSLSEVVRRHETLRTTFQLDGARPVQVIAAAAPVATPAVDLRGLPEAARRDEALRLSAAAVARPFDLERGPLFASLLLRLAEEEHALLVNVHHIVSDGWSTGVLLSEVAALYAAFARAEPSPLAELPIQYADYGAWQRDWMAGPVLERQLAYWREKLAGAPPALDLATDRPRPAVQTYHAGQLSRRLAPELASALSALSRRHGATLFMTLLAGFELLLSRLAGQEDVVVGTPIAGRGRVETEGLVGLFLNTLALRTDLSGSPSYTALLGRVRETALGAYQHQDVPFEKLLEALRPGRDLARTSLFQVFFNLLNLPKLEVELPGLTFEAVPAKAAGSKFDLTLYAVEHDGGIGFEWVYNADLFDAARIELLAAQLESLLAQAIAAPERSIDSYSLALDADRALLPDPSRPLESEWHGSVVERLAAHAAATPGRVALVEEERSWTYAELDEATAKLASHLRSRGIGKVDVVAIYARRGAPLVWAILGTWKAGAAFVILDSAYPAERLVACVAQARPRALIELAEPPAALAEALAGLPFASRVAWGGEGGEDWSLAPAGSDSDLGAEPNLPEDLAYVAFTSGSTGTPKGILGTHRPLSHFLAWHGSTFDLGRDDRFAMTSGLSHDPLLRDVLAPLWLGATLAVSTPEVMREPELLLGWLARQRVTALHLTPAMGQLLASGAPVPRLAAGPPAGEPALLADLRWAFFGGGTLSGRDVERLRRLAPQARAVNFYGATETPQAIAWSLADGEPEGAVPLGRGIEGVDLLVLTREGTLAGRGERGEISVRTPYLASGYLGDLQATAERFVVNPATGAPGDRLYRTGDLGRYRLDGAVEYLGRADGQVNVRGLRVEVGEIEAALLRSPAVREAAVVAREEEDGETRLVAYVVPAGGPGAAAGAGELRAFLGRWLPEPMVPGLFVTLEALPLTPNGKVDRRALPAPRGERPELESAFVEPGSPLERAIAEVWRHVLKLDRVGLRDNFFELGGSSLSIAEVRVYLRRHLGRELPLVDLFRFPTIGTLAAHLARQGAAEAPSFTKVEERVQRGKLALERQRRAGKARQRGP